MTESLMESAAEDLHIEFEILHTMRDPFLAQERLESLLARPRPPDVVVFSNEKAAVEKFLPAVERSRSTYAVSIVNGVSDAQRRSVGRPGERMRRWIGEIAPDNVEAGRLLGSALAAGLRNCPVPVQILALGGDRLTSASVERLAGLAADDKQSAQIVQTIYLGWDKARIRAKEVLADALRRYPRLCGVWAVNDAMALGALDGARAHGRVPGHTFFAAGAGWDSEALALVREGDMVASVGGHFSDGLVALLWISKWWRDRTIAPFVIKSHMVLATRNDSLAGARCAGADPWGCIDFSQFRSDLDEFSPRLLLEAIQRAGSGGR